MFDAEINPSRMFVLRFLFIVSMAILTAASMCVFIPVSGARGPLPGLAIILAALPLVAVR